ncbi:fructose-1,6-bisphosphatase [Rubidibacter lacunae KORDI 51-2]|uniref:Inositol-1-monophosphatase n=1 Tax=Rubidibacter lacunae KORDI 51-2 TaxID=582515 RepID=U5DIA3_9CHRO|nr:inositol monophosphatase family protein [Rubidibacter lacunae]ERN40329.1 fructose-1,6-bisphosphatase [Rubidibacter lacunae KORDI 51-2]
MTNLMTLERRQVHLDIATEAASTAGAILREHFGKLASIEDKRPGDLVTDADKASEAAILEVLQRHLPDHAILAEESGRLGNLDSNYCWAIDPLDGTTNYAHQLPIASVSIALLVDDVPCVGVVYNPFRNELFRAATGLGATRNRQPMSVTTTASLDRSLLVTGFAYDRRETSDNNYAEFCYLTHLTRGVRRLGSAALDLADVACGRLDGYWERGLSLWDIAAGVVLVREAGGCVTAYDGSPVDLASGRLMATNGVLHVELGNALARAPQEASRLVYRS